MGALVKQLETQLHTDPQLGTDLIKALRLQPVAAAYAATYAVTGSPHCPSIAAYSGMRSGRRRSTHHTPRGPLARSRSSAVRYRSGNRSGPTMMIFSGRGGEAGLSAATCIWPSVHRCARPPARGSVYGTRPGSVGPARRGSPCRSRTPPIEAAARELDLVR
jgi:hypothetical protein